VFEQTLSQCQELVRRQGQRKKFPFKNKLMSLDESIIDLSVSMFDWAKFRQTKGAIKLHLLLDHDGYLPSFAVVTEGKTSEIKVARTLRFAPGTILAIDRGYNDYEWFRELTRGAGSNLGVAVPHGSTGKHRFIHDGRHRRSSGKCPPPPSRDSSNPMPADSSASACTIRCAKPANGSSRSYKPTSPTMRYQETSTVSAYSGIG
jgi:hypothetical protein